MVYQDRHLIVVNKPAELLSVPGLAMIDSVQSRLQQRHPDLPELQLVHRLDQSTSGLLLLAKTRRDHKALQRQFSERTISKEYIALLDGEVLGEQGEISLPLRVDLEDRPRQLVCDQHGKPALTRWRVLAREGGRTRVALMPVTGRTHQLRVHMAHALGLSAPIVGDELYGKPGDRLYLHAQSLAFIHPGTGERARFSVPAPF
ncbi:MAG: RluA family pseudouridine synthase [Granulosicoccaceae bacterium]